MSITNEIKELIATSVHGNSVDDILKNCLTLNGKISLNEALKSLSAFEKVIFEGLKKNEITNNKFEEVVIAFRPHGRLLIVNSNFAKLHNDFLSIVYKFRISSDLYDLACEASKRELCDLESYRNQINNLLFDSYSKDIASDILEATKHMAPLIFYIGENCYSNFYEIGRSTYPREHELNKALIEVIENRNNASIDALTLTYCLKLLFTSGSYTRPEEMNSSQLTLPTLQRHFRILAFRYQEACDISDEEMHEFMESPIYTQAVLLSRYRDKASLSGQFVRDIHGISLLKKERYIRRWSADSATHRLVQRAQSLALIEDATNGLISHEYFISPNKFSKCLHANSQLVSDLGFSSDLEYLIDALIHKSISATQSDVGMTRGTRSFLQLVQLLDSKDTVSACQWSQSEYFCHAVPSEHIKKVFPAKTIAMLLNAVSSRMRYNTWHYAPSYFDISTIPTERGWFHAPKMADIAEWSDQHHAGHVHASIRHSIRSPQTIYAGDIALTGFIDLRLMRQSGEKYSMTDLITAIAYTDALRLLYQALMDFVRASNTDFRFTFGDKQWIDSQYLSRTGAF